MFPTLSGVVITGGTFNHQTVTVTVQSQKSYEHLQDASAPNAFHNSGERRDPPKCHPNTRVAILHYIHLWIAGVDSQDREQQTQSVVDVPFNKPIMWMYGPAGAGKSAIAQSISDACHDEQRLLAAFYFSRFDASRNHAKSLIPTIVYQIAQCFPGQTRKLIVDHIDLDPLIFTHSLQTQMFFLVVNPLKPLIKSGYFEDTGNCRRVVIIDGLDECNDREDQVEILKVISNTLRKYDIPLIFLIASRPEHDLVGAFRSEPLQSISTMLPLDNGYRSHQDIELFLQDNFTQLITSHPFRSLIPPVWPGEDIMQNLALKSSGQFIYAATVMKYIRSTRHSPPDRLDVILGLQPPNNKDMPFSELDALYTHIFASLPDPEPVLQILAFSILSGTRYSIK